MYIFIVYIQCPNIIITVFIMTAYNNTDIVLFTCLQTVCRCSCVCVCARLDSSIISRTFLLKKCTITLLLHMIVCVCACVVVGVKCLKNVFYVFLSERHKID